MFSENFVFYYSFGLIKGGPELDAKLQSILKGPEDEEYNFFKCHDSKRHSIGVKPTSGPEEMPFTEWLKLLRKGSARARIYQTTKDQRNNWFWDLYDRDDAVSYPCWDSEDHGISSALEITAGGKKSLFILEREHGSPTYFAFRQLPHVPHNEPIPLEHATAEYAKALHKSATYVKPIYHYLWRMCSLGLFFLESKDLKMTSQADAEKTVLAAGAKYGLEKIDFHTGTQDDSKLAQSVLTGISPMWDLKWPENKMRAFLALLCYDDLESEIGAITETRYDMEEYLEVAFMLSEARYALEAAL